jgi:hypothetical protein
VAFIWYRGRVAELHIVPIVAACMVAPVVGLAWFSTSAASTIWGTAHDGQTVEDANVSAQMAMRFDALRTEALTGRASLSLIEKVAEERWK